MAKEVIKVLIVDDDIDYSVLLGMYLSRDRDNQYETILCHSGADAIANCKVQTFDCVLVDYRLNDMTGAEVIEELRKCLDEKMPPVVVVTSGGLEDAAINSLRARATDFLLKDNANNVSVGRVVKNAVEQGRLNRGVHERRRELIVANLELERQKSEIQRFYHVVSHEIKTPLTATREFVSIVTDGLLGPVNDAQLEVLQDALICCDQISMQFNDLIDLTRLETGKLSLNINSVCPAAMFKRVMAIGKERANEKGISLQFKVRGEMSPVNIDEARVTQVLNNLIGNAIKFTDKNGTVRLSVSGTENHTLHIRITDTGCGVAKAYREDIFERLYQVHTHSASHAQEGLGLGLSIAREIIRGHGKELGVRSRLGVGSCFHFQLNSTQHQKALNYGT